MLKLGLISNPRSQRNRRGLEDIHAVTTGVRDLIHLVADDRQSLPEMLADLARQEIGLLVINGGDGTLQRVLTELLEGRQFAAPPLIAILPRGMANTAAGDVGLRGRPARALGRLIDCIRAGEIGPQLAERHVMRIENIRGMPPQRAMFLGAAAVHDAIEFCRSKVYAVGLKGNLGMGLALGGLLLGALRGRGQGLLRGHDVALGIDDRPARRAQRLLVLATTLDRLILGSRPFWGEGSRSIRFTSIAFPPVQLIRSAPKVLYGWRRATLPPEAYLSGGAERLTLGLDGAFALDGEVFEPQADAPLLVTAPDRLRFVRL